MDRDQAASEEKRLVAVEQLALSQECDAEGDTAGARRANKEAWYALEEALEICPMNHRARFLLVSCAMNVEDYKRAKDEAQRIYRDLSADGGLQKMNDSVLHLVLAHASKMLEESGEAVRYALEATNLFPDDPQPYMILGEIYEARNQDEEAEHQCRQALRFTDNPECSCQLSPQKVYFTLCCLSTALIKQGKYSEAEFFLLRAIRESDGTQTLALHHLFDTYIFQGRPRDAKEAGLQILDINPDDEEIIDKLDNIQYHSRSYSPRSTRSNEMSVPRRRGSQGSLRYGGNQSYRNSQYSSSRGQHNRNGYANSANIVVGNKKGEIDVPLKNGSRNKKKEDNICSMCCLDR